MIFTTHNSHFLFLLLLFAQW